MRAMYRANAHAYETVLVKKINPLDQKKLFYTPPHLLAVENQPL